MNIRYLLTVMTASALLVSCKSEQQSLPAIIPLPAQMEAASGAFVFHPSTRISYTGGEEAAAVAEQLAGMLRPATGFALKTSEGTGGNFRLLIDTSGVWKPEEYRLSVTKYITVVPEIEMPAHVGSALAAYPEFSCTGGPFTVPPGSVALAEVVWTAAESHSWESFSERLPKMMERFDALGLAYSRESGNRQ